MLIHLVLTALGAVAVKTQSLVGHELVDNGEATSSKGNTVI